MRQLLLAAVLASLATTAAAADPREFCAERPGKATPPCILDAGRFQLETGLADAVFLRGRAGHEDTYTLGASEVRFGVSSRTEIEAGWSPLIVDHQRGAGRTTGVGDAMLGVRTALTDPDADGPAASIQGFVTAPTATHGLGAGGWTGGLRLPLAMPLGHDLDLGATPEVDLVRDADGHGTHLALQAAAGLSHGFGALTAGAELWGQVDDDPAHRAWQASADLTAALMIGKNAQIDAGVNLGLTHATPDVEIYAGVARRF
ncbi:MAG: transporter [Alphaproteobacteria bacterium]|nr:transporter [Alphaproteobacteria bacterium]MBU1516319.1 transporter [Alphaproteobacteria bacterium]MBU2093159.1 transporter [Alphaproteobacteria bacterium]MBU2150419.1 transporter [Alphaproteobacteria bacterium]MBU2308795.1 transporter [Alphaproteobacteria bacterium]